jgi:apolipoprotein N-acyltransferase
LTIFAASVLLAALLIASYGTRRIWLACLSIVLSAALVAGAIFVATTETPAEGRAKLASLAGKFSLVFDRQALDAVTASLERLEACPRPGITQRGSPHCRLRQRGLVRCEQRAKGSANSR